MGCSVQDVITGLRNAEIENQLIQDKPALRNEVKILLSGERCPLRSCVGEVRSKQVLENLGNQHLGEEHCK
jgi:hypothetical protein